MRKTNYSRLVPVNVSNPSLYQLREGWPRTGASADASAAAFPEAELPILILLLFEDGEMLLMLLPGRIS
jgi:hypothetical protein